MSAKIKQLRQIDRLAEWLRKKRRETGYSFPEIARRSGGLISQGTAANVANKRYDTIDPRTIDGLARAFDITAQEVWDVANGLAPESEPAYETRELALPDWLWRLIDQAARKSGRTWLKFIEVVFIAYFGGEVNLNTDRLKEIRRDAVIIPLNTGGEGDLPFTRESDQAKKRSAKTLSKRK